MSFHRTFIGGTAVASDIAEGKTATVNNIELTGTKGQNSGIVLEVVPPTGISDSSFTPATEHGAVLLKNTAITLANYGGWVLGTNGFSTNIGTYSGFASADGASAGVPAYSGKRKYEIWGRFADAALADGEGARVLFNLENNSYANYWAAAVKWVSVSGLFQIILYEVTASVFTSRATANFTTALDLPAEFHLVVYEQGDAVIVQCVMFETDNITDDEAVSCAYTVGSRPHKSNTRFSFSLESDPETDCAIRGCRISDID